MPGWWCCAAHAGHPGGVAAQPAASPEGPQGRSGCRPTQEGARGHQGRSWRCCAGRWWTGRQGRPGRRALPPPLACGGAAGAPPQTALPSSSAARRATGAQATGGRRIAVPQVLHLLGVERWCPLARLQKEKQGGAAIRGLARPKKAMCLLPAGQRGKRTLPARPACSWVRTPPVGEHHVWTGGGRPKGSVQLVQQGVAALVQQPLGEQTAKCLRG